MPDDTRRELVALLGYIAAGRAYLPEHEDLPSGRTTADNREIANQLRHVDAARQAVALELPSLVAALGDHDRRMDWTLAFAASQVPESASSALKLVSRLAANVTQPHLAAALTLTSQLAGGNDSTAGAERAMRLLDEDDLVQVEGDREWDPARWPRTVAELLFEHGFEQQELR